MREALRSPEDEQSWDRLEELRRAVCQTAVDEDVVNLLEKEEVEALASAMEHCDSARFADEVGNYTDCGSAAKRVENLIPTGSRVLLDRPSKAKAMSNRRKRMVAAVRAMARAPGELRVRVQRQPLSTRRAPLVLQDKFAKTILSDMRSTVEQIASTWEPERLSKEEVLDKLLLVLHDALFLQQAEGWSQSGVARVVERVEPELLGATVCHCTTALT